MGTTLRFPDKVFGGRRYTLDSLFLSASREEARRRAERLRREGWLARVAEARSDTAGQHRIGYLGVYKRRK